MSQWVGVVRLHLAVISVALDEDVWKAQGVVRLHLAVISVKKDEMAAALTGVVRLHLAVISVQHVAKYSNTAGVVRLHLAVISVTSTISVYSIVGVVRLHLAVISVASPWTGIRCPGVVRLHLAVISVYRNITFWNTKQKSSSFFKKSAFLANLEQKKVIFSVQTCIPLRFVAGGFRGPMPFGSRSAARFFLTEQAGHHAYKLIVMHGFRNLFPGFFEMLQFFALNDRAAQSVFVIHVPFQVETFLVQNVNDGFTDRIFQFAIIGHQIAHTVDIGRKVRSGRII